MSDFDSDIHLSTCADKGVIFDVSALSSLVQRAIKIIYHQDGTHGVYRRFCDGEKVVARAQRQRFLLLDLGHVVRLYFGDDYYDVLLESEVLYDRSENLNSIVGAVAREVEQNTALEIQ